VWGCASVEWRCEGVMILRMPDRRIWLGRPQPMEVMICNRQTLSQKFMHVYETHPCSNNTGLHIHFPSTSLLNIFPVVTARTCIQRPTTQLTLQSPTQQITNPPVTDLIAPATHSFHLPCPTLLPLPLLPSSASKSHSPTPLME